MSIDKLARRALWWFRWAAVSTFVLGLLITGSVDDYWKSFMTTDSGAGLGHNSLILVGMVLGTTMMLNVWGVIWRNQKVVLANAANVLAGGEANPGAAGAGRAALLASRQNFIYSFSMLYFMVAAPHLGGLFNVDSAGKAWAFVGIALGIAALLELMALGFVGGKAATNKLLWPYESHKNALITGGVLWVVLYILSELLLKSSPFN